MSIESVISLISSVGFPIVACVYLVTFCKEMLAQHTEESKSFTEAINNNTAALIELRELVKNK